LRAEKLTSDDAAGPGKIETRPLFRRVFLKWYMLRRPVKLWRSGVAGGADFSGRTTRETLAHMACDCLTYFDRGFSLDRWTCQRRCPIFNSPV